jgi:hypothetical protein
MYNLFEKRIFIVFIFGMLIFSSCKKALDVPLTADLESNYFTTEERVQRGIGSIYASLSNMYGANLGQQVSQNGVTLQPSWMLEGDDLTTNSSGSNTAYEAFSGLTASDSRITGIWQKFYFMLYRANFMLNKLNDPAVIQVFKTPGLRDRNRGEALFLRAWVNYKLWDMFRKAPVQNSRIKAISEAVLPPSKDFELLDSAIVDLNKAATLLPESWDDLNKGRVFKNSAYGLLVKCYVLRACYATKYSGGNMLQNYGDAITAFKKISSVSTIEGVLFGNNFDYRTENNSESLFEYQASFGQISDNPWLDNDVGPPVGSLGAFYHYFDNHWSNYGSGSIMGPTPKLVNMFDPLDPRANETFKLAQNVDNNGGVFWWLGSAWSYFGGYQFVKYINGTRSGPYDPDFAVMSMNNPRLLRLADVKLAVAEAYLETGDVIDATIQVNDVRKRARLSTPTGVKSPVPANYATVTMQNIMDERLFELAGEENFRWSDLKRWHAAGYINLSKWTAVDFGYPYNPSSLFTFDVNKHMLFPIPNSEMLNNPLMNASGNNPGY